MKYISLLVLVFISNFCFADYRDHDLNHDGKADVSIQYSSYKGNANPFYIVYDYRYNIYEAYPADDQSMNLTYAQRYDQVSSQFQDLYRENVEIYFNTTQLPEHERNFPSLLRHLRLQQQDRLLSLAADILKIDVHLLKREIHGQSPMLKRCDRSALVLTLDLLKKGSANFSTIGADETEVKAEYTLVSNTLSEKVCSCMIVCARIKSPAQRQAFMKDFTPQKM